METLRTFLEGLRRAGELGGIRRPVDVRHVAALLDPASTALLLHRELHAAGHPSGRRGALSTRGLTAFTACDTDCRA